MKEPRTLVGWIAQACERPGMYFGTPDQPYGNVHVFGGWISGDEDARRRLGQPSEHRAFVGWIQARRPDLNRSHGYEHDLLREANGDHGQVFDQIRRWALEFEASRGGEQR